MAIYNPIKARHKKRRAVIKAHFAKKRATADKSAAKPAPKLKTTIIDAGHKPSEAKLARLMKTFPDRRKAAPSYKAKDVATTKRVAAVTKPAPTPYSASAAPKITVPQADSAESTKTSIPIGTALKVVGGVAVGAASIYAATRPSKAMEAAVKRAKPPTGELAVQRGELAIQRGELAKTTIPKVDVKGLGQRGPALSAKIHTETAKLAAAVRERVGDPYAKKRTSLRTAIGAAERADVRKVTKQKLVALNEQDLARLERKVKSKAPKPKTSVERVGFYNVEQLDAYAKRIEERRTTPREGADRRKAAPAPKVKKAVTGSAVGKQRREAQKAKFKASKTKTVAPSGMTQKQITARISELERDLGQTKHPVPKPAAQQVTGTKPKTDVDFKQPKTPDLPKTPKTPVLTAPATVSEKQKQRADRKFYRAKEKKYRQQQAKVDPRIPVTSTENVPAQRAQAEAEAIKLKKNKARIVEIETSLKAGEYRKEPSTTIHVRKPSAAERFGTTEAEIAKVARRIETVKPSAETTAKFEAQMKTAPADVKALQAKIKALETSIAKVEVPTVGSKLRATEAGVSIKVPTPEVRAPVGKRLPMPQPERRTTRDMAKAEQAKAVKTDKPVAPPKVTKAQATAVKAPETTAQRTVRTQGAYAARQRAIKPTPKLTSPAIGASLKSKIKPTIKGGALLAGVFSALEAGEAAAKEHRPGKRAEVALKTAKESAGATIKSIAAYTGTAAITTAAVGKVASGAIFKVALPAYLTYKVGKELTIPALKKLGKQVEATATSRREAKQEKAASEKKYGTVFAATRTRHAKEAYKVAQQKKKTLTRLIKARDKKDIRKTFGLRDV